MLRVLCAVGGRGKPRLRFENLVKLMLIRISDLFRDVGNFQIGVDTVSYTHLDVYKRQMHVCAGVMARYEHQQNTDLHDAEVHVIRLGEIAFATNSFELFLDYGNRIRESSKAQQTFLIKL